MRGEDATSRRSRRQAKALGLAPSLLLALTLGCASVQDGGGQVPPNEQSESVENAAAARASLAQLRQAAEAGDPEAQSQLAFALQRGRGVEIDHTAAVLWHRKAAEQGELASQTELGRYFLEGTGGVQKQQLRGLHWIRKAAHAGDPDAQAQLGAVFLHGLGRSRVRPDYAKAEKWLLSASEQGVVQADYDLATLYLKRDDTEKALEFLRRAVQRDHAESNALLSSLYRDGRGVAQDEAESVRLLARAAELGDPEAQTGYGISLRDGTRTPRDENASFRWFEKAAQSGNIDAQFNLGKAYFYGTGVEPDRVRGVAWLEVCRTEIHRDSIRELGRVRDQLSAEELAAVEALREEIAASLAP